MLTRVLNMSRQTLSRFLGTAFGLMLLLAKAAEMV